MPRPGKKRALPRYARQAVDQQVGCWVMLHVLPNPLPICTPPPDAGRGQAHLMTVFQAAAEASFAAFGIDAVYTPADGARPALQAIARRPDTIVGLGDTRILRG